MVAQILLHDVQVEGDPQRLVVVADGTVAVAAGVGDGAQPLQNPHQQQLAGQRQRVAGLQESQQGREGPGGVLRLTQILEEAADRPAELRQRPLPVVRPQPLCTTRRATSRSVPHSQHRLPTPSSKPCHT